MDIFEEIIEQKRIGKPAVLATVVEASGSTPRGAGAKMLVKSDGTTVGTVGGGAIEKLAIDEATSMMHTPGAKLIKHKLKEIDMMCGGGMTVFVESLNPAPKLYIFGAGHIGRVLSQIASELGFHVTVIDNRTDVATPQNLPWAAAVIADEYLTALQTLGFDPNTYVVILTHKHAHDFEVLAECVQRQHRYLGMIGSKKKVASCFEQLRDSGVAEETIKSIHAPIGIKIGGSTPAEIAVSIAAELVTTRNQGDKSFPACPSEL